MVRLKQQSLYAWVTLRQMGFISRRPKCNRFNVKFNLCLLILLCFDAVGWARGRASHLYKTRFNTPYSKAATPDAGSLEKRPLKRYACHLCLSCLKYEHKIEDDKVSAMGSQLIYCTGTNKISQ